MALGLKMIPSGSATAKNPPLMPFLPTNLLKSLSASTALLTAAAGAWANANRAELITTSAARANFFIIFFACANLVKSWIYFQIALPERRVDVSLIKNKASHQLTKRKIILLTYV